MNWRYSLAGYQRRKESRMSTAGRSALVAIGGPPDDPHAAFGAELADCFRLLRQFGAQPVLDEDEAGVGDE